MVRRSVQAPRDDGRWWLNGLRADHPRARRRARSPGRGRRDRAVARREAGLRADHERGWPVRCAAGRRRRVARRRVRAAVRRGLLLRRHVVPGRRPRAVPGGGPRRQVPRAAARDAVVVLDVPRFLTVATGGEEIVARCRALAGVSEESGRLTRRYATPAMTRANALVGSW